MAFLFEKGRSYIIRARRRINKIRSFILKLFDSSITSRFVCKARKKALGFSNRTVGIFLFTFGAYAVIISMILSLFTDIEGDRASLYGGTLCALSSLPLLFSKGSIATSLTKSRTGEVICKYLSIRAESIANAEKSSALGYAFLLGVICGLLTLMLPFTRIIAFIGLMIVLAVILCTPEAGIPISLFLLLIAGTKPIYFIITVMLLSFAFKLLRGKRHLSFEKSDLIMLTFAVCTVGAVVVSTSRSVAQNASDHIVFLLPYFLCIFLIRSRSTAVKLMSVGAVTMGVLSSLYVLGAGVSALPLPEGIYHKDLLLESVRSLPVFQGTFAPVAMAALIPVCAAFIIRPVANTSRATLYLSLVSMGACLLITEQLAYVSAALIATFILLLATGSRKIYFSISAIMAVFVALLFAGSFGDRLFNYIYVHISEAYHQARSLFSDASLPVSARYIFCGSGFTGSVDEGSNFYLKLISNLGIVGFIVIFFAILILFFRATSLMSHLRKSTGEFRMNMRFASRENRSAMNTATAAGLSVIIALLAVATFTDFYSDSSSYTFFFMMLGTVSAFIRCNEHELARSLDHRDALSDPESAEIIINHTK